MADAFDVDSILAAYANVLEEQTSEEFIREATAFGTTPSGEYLMDVAKKEWRHEYKPFGNALPKPARLRAHLQLTVKDMTTGQRKGVVFTDASPIIGRYDSGSMDNPSKLWGQLALAHDAAKRGLTARELYEEIGKFAYRSSVTELFLVPGENGREKWERTKDPEQVKQYKASGVRAMNVVDNFKQVA